jgi:hypothetical protein
MCRVSQAAEDTAHLNPEMRRISCNGHIFIFLHFLFSNLKLFISLFQCGASLVKDAAHLLF